MIGPVLVVAGTGGGIHEIAWFLYYGGLGDVARGTAITVVAGLGWVVVTTVSLLGWGLIASVLAWIALTTLCCRAAR